MEIRQVEGGWQSEEFSFRIEDFAHGLGEKICIEFQTNSQRKLTISPIDWAFHKNWVQKLEPSCL
jgi:hypothetical protein